jgi:hypothetical protein
VQPTPRPAATSRPGRAPRYDPPAKSPKPAKPRRRGGGLLRFLRFLVSLLALVTVPLVAMVAAYSVIAGVTVEEAFYAILEDVQRLLQRV